MSDDLEEEDVELDLDGGFQSTLDASPLAEGEAKPEKPKYYCAGADRKDEEGRKFCDYRSSRPWSGRCVGCGRYYDCRPIKRAHGAGPQQVSTSAAAILSLKPRARISTGIEEFDKVLNGGLVRGSTLMFGAIAGTGKTSILFQVAVNIAKAGTRVFLASGEMTGDQNLEYLQRVAGADVTAEVLDRIHLFCDTRGINIVEATDRAMEWKAKVFFLDSAQHAENQQSRADMGTPEQVNLVMEWISSYSQTKRVASVIISHLTKGEDFAGPQTAQHAADGLLMLDKLDVLSDDRTENLYGTARNGETILREIYWKGKSRQGPSDVRALMQVTEQYRFESISDTVKRAMSRLR